MSLVRIYTASSTSPIVSLYGGAGDYEMILRYLDGWYSTPDAKVKLTERASGDGAHDVSAEAIIYGTRTITADYRILADSRSELLAHERELLSLAHQQVRFRVTDDDSDLFASGYVDSVVKDKSQQNLAKQTETGRITIICPRPERLAWSPLQSQLFPVSVMQGGLRYSTVRQLVSAWTGTPNNSTSTLSQNGKVVATNLDIDPACLQIRYCNPTTVSARQNADDTWTYTTIDGNMRWIIPIFTIPVTVPGMIIFVQWAETNVQQDGVEGTLVASGPGWAAYTVNAKLKMGIYYPVGVSFTLLHIGFYTAADWQAMQSLRIDWFSGDSYSGKGLSYPLNYGTGGVASNVALLLNQGSSKAFPVLTVTGSFPNGVQIQWGGNALQYDGTIGAVPLILDSRSQTASMGGVDVSRNLSRRDFPMVPANGSVSLRLMSAGTGWVTAVCRDTYI